MPTSTIDLTPPATLYVATIEDHDGGQPKTTVHAFFSERSAVAHGEYWKKHRPEGKVRYRVDEYRLASVAAPSTRPSAPPRSP